jgi:hypothetical protein
LREDKLEEAAGNIEASLRGTRASHALNFKRDHDDNDYASQRQEE